jgi:Cupin domain
MTSDLEFEDTLSDYIRRIEEAEEKADLTSPIITSDDLPIEPDFRDDIEREQIGWRLYQHPMFYIVKVKGGTDVPEHSHDEDVFRYIISGSLEIRVGDVCRNIRAGQWVVVKSNSCYSISTSDGYVAMIAYQIACRPK